MNAERGREAIKNADGDTPRFRFGKNWLHYAERIDEGRVATAKQSLRDSLGVISLDGYRFLDVGSGSGLFSLAAYQLGAEVISFDYDQDSVKCTRNLRDRFSPDAGKDWRIEQGSILDTEFLETIGTFDIVYSWGVLHHTGEMWQALENTFGLTSPDGRLFIALYNDQGRRSKFWTIVKRTYCASLLGRAIVLAVFIPIFASRAALSSIVFFRNTFRIYKKNRGMSIFYDWVDWLGGYPFEVAKIDSVVSFFVAKGMLLCHIRSTCSLGCNEFVFRRVES